MRQEGEKARTSRSGEHPRESSECASCTVVPLLHDLHGSPEGLSSVDDDRGGSCSSGTRERHQNSSRPKRKMERGRTTDDTANTNEDGSGRDCDGLNELRVGPLRVTSEICEDSQE